MSASRPCIDRFSTASPLVNGYSGHFPPHYIDPVAVARARRFVSGLFYLARRRPLVIVVNDQFDQSRSLQGHDRRAARHPAARRQRRRIDVPPAGPGRRRATRRAARRSRRPCAMPAGTSWSSTSARLVCSRRSRSRCGAATKISRRSVRDRNVRGWTDVDGVVGRMDRRHGRRSHAGRSAAGADAHPAAPASGRAIVRVYPASDVDEDGADGAWAVI